MKKINVFDKLIEIPQGFSLVVTGEAKAEEIRFVLRSFTAAIEGLTFYLKYRSTDETVADVVLLTREGKELSWTPDGVFGSIVGKATMQIYAQDSTGERVWESVIAYMTLAKTMGEVVPIGEHEITLFQQYIGEMQTIKSETLAEASRIVDEEAVAKIEEINDARATAIRIIESEKDRAVAELDSVKDDYVSIVDGYADSKATELEAQLDIHTASKEEQLNVFTNAKKSEISETTESVKDEVGSYADAKKEEINSAASGVVALVTAEGDSQVARVSEVLDTELSELRSENKAQTEKIKTLEFDVLDLQSSLDGVSQVSLDEPSNGGVISVPSPTRGTLSESARVLKVKGDTVKGRNLWDEEYIGGIFYSNGNTSPTANGIMSKNYMPCEGGKSYYITTGFVGWYDSDKTFISRTSGEHDAPSPSNARFFKITTDNTYGTTYKNDICINVYDSMNGTYSPYFEGIKDSENIVVESRGANIWDEEWDVGGIVNSDGSFETSSSFIRSKNFIPVSGGTTYFRTKTVDATRIFFYTYSKGYISNYTVETNGGTFVTPSNCAFVLFKLYATSYNHDIAIFKGSEARPYEPYKHDSITIPISLKKGDVYEPSTGMLSERYVKYAFTGSESWTDTGTYKMTGVLQSLIKKVATNSTIADMVSSIPVVKAYDDIYTGNVGYGIAVDENGRIRVGKDVDVTKIGTILYEPAEPIAPHKVTEPINSQLSVYAGGSVRVTSGVAQAEAEVQFRVNYSVKDELSELKKELAEQKAINTAQGYDIENMKALAEGRISEEKTLTTTNGVAQLESDFVAPNALVSELIGKTDVGHNLLDLSNLTAQTSNGVTFTPVYSRGLLDYILVNGTATANVGYWFQNVNIDGECILSGCPSGGNAYSGYCMYFAYSGSFVADEGSGINVTFPSSANIGIRVASGTVCNNLKFYPMLRKATVVDGTYKAFDGLHSSSDAVVKSVCKNLIGGIALANRLKDVSYTCSIDEASGTVTYDRYKNANDNVVFDGFKANTQYTIRLVAKSSTGANNSMLVVYTDGTSDALYLSSGILSVRKVTTSGKSVKSISLGYGSTGIVSLDYNNCGVYEGDTTSYTPYMEPSTFAIPTDWYTKTQALGYDLGLEGTVIDIDRKEVRWTYGKDSLDGKSYNFDGTRYSTSINGIKNASARTVRIVSKYLCKSNGEGYDSTWNDVIYNGGGTSIYIHASASPTGDIVYELATPIVKTFEELGMTPIDPQIRIEGGGTITVESTGAQAEATVRYLKKYVGGN